MDRIVETAYIPLLQELIKNRCVNDGTPDSGQEHRSVQTLERFFHGYGLTGEVLTCRGERSSFLLRIPGTNPSAPSLMYMGHLDVVPADPAGWKYPPFDAVLAENRLWGRGSLDMLGQTAAMAAAAAEIYRAGVRLPGDLLFLAVADEEAAGVHGARWLTENHWEKVKADFMITELGGFYLDLAGPPRAVVTVGEKGVTQLRVRARGQASHGSLPFGVENAALKIAALVQLAGTEPPPPRGGAFFRTILRALHLPEGLETRLAGGDTIDEALRELALVSPGTARLLHACSRMTVSPNRMEAGTKVNIIAASGSLELDIRTLPGEPDWRTFLEDLVCRVDPAMELEVLESFPSTTSDHDTPLMDAVRRTVGTLDGDTTLVPLLTSVATDGRYWRQRGTCVYGFSCYGRDATMGNVFSLIHGRDESISVESLERGYRFFRNLPEDFFLV
jgi:acetylornithine deacetylase/succinyl-diaminopimelate desuccinylase-like protein